MVPITLPKICFTRYGIRCVPMWNLPEEIRQENKVLIFGGEQEEVTVLDTKTNKVEFKEKAPNIIKSVLSMNNKLKMGG